MATEVIKPERRYKKVPYQIIITGNRIDKGDFQLVVLSTLRKKAPNGNELEEYENDESKRTVMEMTDDEKAILMPLLGQVIDRNWQPNTPTIPPIE